MRYRIAEGILILLGVGWLVAPQTGLLYVWLIIAWDVLALAYCTARWIRIRAHRTDADEPGTGPPEWLHGLLGRRTSFIGTVLVSVIGMSAGGIILIARVLTGASASAEVGVILQVLAAPAVVMAWLLLHFGYADRYAHMFYLPSASPPLAFPETDRPNLLDFAYFSFTIGSSFAASDVEVRSRPVRYTVLVHSVLSFFYNTAILGIAIGVVTGI